MNSSTFDSTIRKGNGRPRGNASAPVPRRFLRFRSRDLSDLPPSLNKFLVAWVARCRQLTVLNAIGWSLAVALIWMLMSCGADRLVALSNTWRTVLLVGGILFPLVVLLAALLPLAKPIDWVAIAQSIERANPHFDQRLITVASRLLGAKDYRGSEQILAALTESVEKDSSKPNRRLPSLRTVVAPWSASLVTICALLLLLLTPDLDLATLLRRYLHPMASIPPVTTTQLRVLPGNSDVNQAEPKRIDVAVKRLGDAPVWLHLNSGGPTWSRVAMDALGEGRYFLTLTSTDHDIHYFVTAGDGASSQYLLRVRRVPAVAQFQIRYTYPPYAKRAPFTVSNTSGIIEAIEGAEVQMTIYATEPLRSASLIIGGTPQPMDCLGQPNAWQTRLKIEKSSSYQLDLLSERNLRGGAPDRAQIVCIPDRPPIVRLEQGDQSFRLAAREIMPLRYQAMDDVGIQSLRVRTQINGAEGASFPAPILGDPRHQENVLNFDLAKLNLVFGDVLTIALEARDGDGHATRSDPLQILVSPRSVDLETQTRIDELNGAAQLAAMLVSEWDEARTALDEADAQPDRQSAAYLSANAQGNRHLTSATEISALLRQSLMRAITHSASPEMSLMLATCVDGAQKQTIEAEDLFRRTGAASGMGNISKDRMQAILDDAKRMQQDVQAVAHGERALAILADRENLKDLNARPRPTDARAVERRVQSAQRISDEIAAGASEVGIDPHAADLDAQLQRRRNVETALLNAAHAPDLVGAARQWAQELVGSDHRQTGFVARLAAAAQAEAVRPDSDLLRARDLELASRAANYIEATTPLAPKQAAANKSLKDFLSAIESLQRAFELGRTRKQQPTPESKLILAEADKARGLIAQLARGATISGQGARPGALGQARVTAAEDLAMQAGAESTNRNYARVRELDRNLVDRLTDSARAAATRASAKPDTEMADSTQQRIGDRIDRIRRAGQSIADSMQEAEAVDHLEQDQDQLASQAVSASGQAGDLANVQRHVADTIAQLNRQHEMAVFEVSSTQPSEQPNRRWRAAAAILTTQEELSAMPQALAAAQASAAARREADVRAAMAQLDATNSNPTDKQTADRAAQQAMDDAKEASRRLEKALLPVTSDAASAMAERVKPFVPETGSAGEILQNVLLPSLRLFEQAAWQNDVAPLEAAAADTRQAIEAAQRELAHAQSIVMQRDPLLAANWYARAAADSLSQVPADLKTALSHQSNVNLALSGAWDRSIHRAAAQRMSILPSFRPVYGPAIAGNDHGAPGTAAATPNFSAVRQWGKLRPRESDQLDSPNTNPDPPGYEESLRLYFQAIEKAQAHQEKAK